MLPGFQPGARCRLIQTGTSNRYEVTRDGNWREEFSGPNRTKERRGLTATARRLVRQPRSRRQIEWGGSIFSGPHGRGSPAVFAPVSPDVN